MAFVFESAFVCCTEEITCFEAELPIVMIHFPFEIKVLRPILVHPCFAIPASSFSTSQIRCVGGNSIVTCFKCLGLSYSLPAFCGISISADQSTISNISSGQVPFSFSFKKKNK